MSDPASLRQLPAFTALEVAPVLAGTRPGASVQLDYSYLDGCIAVYDALDRGPTQLRERFASSRTALGDAVESVRGDVDVIETDVLRRASAELSERFASLPIVEGFDAAFPGRVVAVPEWNRLDNTLDFGARVYFFPSEDGPRAAEIYERNVEAVAASESARFERYQGSLHGYPDCCIGDFLDREGSSPERRSVEAMAGYLSVRALPGPGASVDDFLTGFFDDPEDDEYAWFAREFFPTPGCDCARNRGRDVYDSLVASYPVSLVRDYFRVNFLYGYAVARRLGDRSATRPGAGDLGRESALLALPLAALDSVERYR